MAVIDSVGNHSTMVYKPLRANHPTEFPPSGVQELAARENGHCTVPVVTNRCEALVLQATESDKVVDLVGED